MKWVIVFLLLPCAASAQQGIQVVHEVATTTGTITQTINVCSAATPVDIANQTSSGTLSGAFAIEGYNPLASTNTMICGFDASLSTQITSAWYGREIPAGTGVLYQVLSSVRKLLCMTTNAGGCTRFTVTQFK